MSAAQELSRLRYLQAMGVPVYVSRRALPGAAPTHKLYLRESARKIEPDDRQAPAPEPPQSRKDPSRETPLAAAVPRPATDASRAPRGSPVPSQLRDSLRIPTPAGTARTADPVPTSGKLTADNANGGAVELRRSDAGFSLAVIICADRLWIEELGGDALATDQVHLIAAIGRALLHPQVDGASPAVTQFDWPLHRNQQLDLSADEAAASLGGYLRRQLDENACSELLCLGDAAAGRLANLQLPCARRTLPSTRAMLEDPRLKAELWRELRRS